MVFDPYKLAAANQSIQRARADLAAMQQQKQMNVERLAGMKQDQQLRAQQLSDLQAAAAQNRAADAMRFGANIHRQIQQNPDQAAALYQSGLSMAQKMNIDVSQLPQQYGSEAEQFLSSISAQVNKPVDPTNLQREVEYYAGIEDPALKRQVGLREGFISKPVQTTPTREIQNFEYMQGLTPEQRREFMADDRKGQKLSARQKDWSTYQNLKQTDPESANQFGQSAGFVDQKGKELTAHLQKRLSTASDLSVKSEGNSRLYSSMADQVLQAEEKGEFGGGLMSSWKEGYKKLAGSQDAISDLRTRYNLIRAMNMTEFLPPGPASDKDVKIIMDGFPPDNANADAIVEFLDTMSRVEAAKSKYEGFKANFISKNGTERDMLKEWRKVRDASEDNEKVENDIMDEQEALQMLQGDPKLIDYFEETYGYRPEGF